LVILAELELWPNFLSACQQRNIKVAVVNGRITEKSLAGYLRIGRWLPRFGNICFYGVQSQLYAERFQELGVAAENIVVTGNIKFDSISLKPSSANDCCWRQWSKNHTLILAASTHHPEEEMLCHEFMRQVKGEHKLVIVPRHPQRCSQLISELRGANPSLEFALFSACKDSSTISASVLIVDALGQLEDAYANSTCCFIGGSLIDHGGQNLLEAAIAKCPIVMGPSYHNFQDEVELLLAREAMLIGQKATDVLEYQVELLLNPEKMRVLAENAYSALESQRGTAKITLNAMCDLGLLPLK
jgi:3-deoxy-D-manno-octulosonic-acid transferase